jgi:hypothetical protein
LKGKKMIEITVKLPEPVVAQLHKQAHVSELSPEALLTQRIVHAFNFALTTETQARWKALQCLRDVAGYLLRTGKPIFEPETLTWRVPVVPNLKRGTPEPIGELRLSAETGEILTEGEAVLKMVDCTMPLFGVQKMADDFQNRLESLMTQHNNGALTEGEQKELAQMVATLETHDLENLRRLVENVRLPARKRDEASVRENQVKILLTRLKDRKGVS